MVAVYYIPSANGMINTRAAIPKKMAELFVRT